MTEVTIAQVKRPSAKRYVQKKIFPSWVPRAIPTPEERSFSARPSDLGQSCRRFLQRLAADRDIEFVHRFTVVSNLSLGHSRGNAGLVQKCCGCPAQAVK